MAQNCRSAPPCAEPHPNWRSRRICCSRKVRARESRRCLLRAASSKSEGTVCQPADAPAPVAYAPYLGRWPSESHGGLRGRRSPWLLPPGARRAGGRAAGAPGSASPKERLPSSGRRQKFTSCPRDGRRTGWETLAGTFFQERFANSRGLPRFGQLLGAGRRGTPCAAKLKAPSAASGWLGDQILIFASKAVLPTGNATLADRKACWEEVVVILDLQNRPVHLKPIVKKRVCVSWMLIISYCDVSLLLIAITLI